MSISFSTSSAFAAIPADLLATAVGGASTTLPNGEPNAVLVGGPAPISFPAPAARPVRTQDEAMARFNDTQRLRQLADRAKDLADIRASGFMDL